MSKNTKKNLDPVENEEEDVSYNAHVKKKLIEWRDNFEKANPGAHLNYSEIAQKMVEQFNIKTTTQKIRTMFDKQSDREVKLPEVAALCQMFHIPMQDICEYPNAPTSDMDMYKLISRKNSKPRTIKHLCDSFYEGRYYCYYFKTKHYQDKLKPVTESELSEAILDISMEGGHTVVTLKEVKTSKNFFGDKVMPSFTLTGNLYHFDNPEMVYSFIADPSGRRAMALMFTYISLSSDIRYYATAGMMTFSQNQTHLPLFQKMAMFRVRQDIYNDPEAAEVLRGILALNTCPIAIDEETLDQLIREDEDMRRLVSPEKAMKKCYIFSEAAIRSDTFFISDDNEKMRKMLKLRGKSLLPAHEVVLEPDFFADFMKHYQMAQIADRADPEEN